MGAGGLKGGKGGPVVKGAIRVMAETSQATQEVHQFPIALRGLVSSERGR